jgi:hypothetical protein
MEDHAYAASGTNQISTPLDSVSALADNINESCLRVEKFLARFHGNPLGEKAAAQLAPVPSGHSAQLTRAHDAAMRLEKLTCELANIG